MAKAASRDSEVVTRLHWVIGSVNVHLKELQSYWASTLGISGPQWLIVLAIADLDQKAEGVPVNAVSKRLHVDASFVTTQSQQLEKKGFLRRRTSDKDARVVQMSLSDKTYKHLAGLGPQQETLNAFIFADFNNKQLNELADKLTAIEGQLKRACLKVTAGL